MENIPIQNPYCNTIYIIPKTPVCADCLHKQKMVQKEKATWPPSQPNVTQQKKTVSKWRLHITNISLQTATSAAPSEEKSQTGNKGCRWRHNMITIQCTLPKPSQKEMDSQGTQHVKCNVKTVKQNATMGQINTKQHLNSLGQCLKQNKTKGNKPNQHQAAFEFPRPMSQTKQKATSQINSMYFNSLGQRLEQNSQWLSLPPRPSNHDYNPCWSLHGFSYTRQTNGFSYTRQTKLTVGLWMHFSKRNSFYIYICTILHE